MHGHGRTSAQTKFRQLTFSFSSRMTSSFIFVLFLFFSTFSLSSRHIRPLLHSQCTTQRPRILRRAFCVVSLSADRSTADAPGARSVRPSRRRLQFRPPQGARRHASNARPLSTLVRAVSTHGLSLPHHLARAHAPLISTAVALSLPVSAHACVGPPRISSALGSPLRTMDGADAWGGGRVCPPIVDRLAPASPQIGRPISHSTGSRRASFRPHSHHARRRPPPHACRTRGRPKAPRRGKNGHIRIRMRLCGRRSRPGAIVPPAASATGGTSAPRVVCAAQPSPNPSLARSALRA